MKPFKEALVADGILYTSFAVDVKAEYATERPRRALHPGARRHGPGDHGF